MKGKQHTEETKAKISEGMKGNNNAEVWTLENVICMLYDIKNYVINNDVYSLSTALVEFDLYSQWWSEVPTKYINEKSVYEAIKQIETIIEQRIVHDTMKGEAKSATFSIFLLKNKFGYVDKVETDNTNNMTINWSEEKTY